VVVGALHADLRVRVNPLVPERVLRWPAAVIVEVEGQRALPPPGPNAPFSLLAHVAGLVGKWLKETYRVSELPRLLFVEVPHANTGHAELVYYTGKTS